MNDVDIHSLCLELTMRYEFVFTWKEEVKYQRGKQVHNLCVSHLLLASTIKTVSWQNYTWKVKLISEKKTSIQPLKLVYMARNSQTKEFHEG